LGGEEVQLLLIHDLSTRLGASGQHHAPAALYPRGKDPRYPLERRLGGPQSRSGHRGTINDDIDNSNSVINNIFSDGEGKI
jgi:hypothetical protein